MAVHLEVPVQAQGCLSPQLVSVDESVALPELTLASAPWPASSTTSQQINCRFPLCSLLSGCQDRAFSDIGFSQGGAQSLLNDREEEIGCPAEC